MFQIVVATAQLQVNDVPAD